LAAAVKTAAWSPVDASRGVRLAVAAVDAAYRPVTAAAPAAERRGWAAELPEADPGRRALLASWIAWADRPDAGTSGRRRLPAAALAVGDVDICLLPGEPFLAADSRLAAGGGRTMTLGYFDDVAGYLPAADDYPAGGYEVVDAHRYYGMPAPFERGTLERLTAEAAALRAGLAGDGAGGRP
jgi:hypothetical protein